MAKETSDPWRLLLLIRFVCTRFGEMQVQPGLKVLRVRRERRLCAELEAGGERRVLAVFRHRSRRLGPESVLQCERSTDDLPG